MQRFYGATSKVVFILKSPMKYHRYVRWEEITNMRGITKVENNSFPFKENCFIAQQL